MTQPQQANTQTKAAIRGAHRCGGRRGTRIAGSWRPRRGCCRVRGSAVVMVVVCLAMMAVLGAAYIQSARVDRAASRRVREVDNVDLVMHAAIAQIRTVLQEDLLDGNGVFFNASSGDEPYDYPWTNDASPGDHDDRWLASTKPSFSNPTDHTTATLTNPHWAHITNLVGTYLQNGSSPADLSEGVRPAHGGDRGQLDCGQV